MNGAVNNPVRPFVAIVGGSKVSTKIDVLDSLLAKVDKLIVGYGAPILPSSSSCNPTDKKNLSDSRTGPRPSGLIQLYKKNLSDRSYLLEIQLTHDHLSTVPTPSDL